MTSVKLNSCAKWNTTGITIAGNKVYGNSSNEFANPTGIFLHKSTKTLYIADHNNARIQMFALNESLVEGITVVSNLKYPTKLYVDNQETIYVALDRSKRVEKWVKGASQGEQVGEQCLECEGVWVDEKKGYVYMSEWIRNRISRWSIEIKNTTTVAGHSDQTGSTAQVLNSPQCFYVNEITDTVYVADKGNHRIQKWMKNAEEGITVAGSNKGERGINATSLWFPEDVFVDDETNIVYIADTNNNRIQRWLSNASSGDTIVGESGTCTAPLEFRSYLYSQNRNNICFYYRSR